MVQRQNVVLLTIDCLRADHLGFYGYDRDTAPFLSSLVSDALVFERAYATGPGTSVSFPSIFGSTYPFDYGGYHGFSPDRTSVAEALPTDVHATGFHSNPYLGPAYGYNRGFDEFVSYTYRFSVARFGARGAVFHVGTLHGCPLPTPPS